MSKPVQQIALALVRRAGQWLVAKRHGDAHLGGLWEFPGGKCLPRESPTQAALRELQEECAVRAAPEGTLNTVVCEYDDRVVYLTPVLCRWISGQPQPLGSESCRWVSSAELQRLEMPAVNAGIISAALAHQAPSVSERDESP